MADQCIVCLENLDFAGGGGGALASPQFDSESLSEPKPGAEAALVASEAATTTTTTTERPSPAPAPAAGPAPAEPAAGKHAEEQDLDNHDYVAVIQVCGHTLHDSCLREWTGKANSCPICRQSFHVVEVFDKVGGTLLTTYEVEDKKQVAEFDAQAWLDDNPEEEEDPTPCPVCNRADHEEVLLLCDGCDTPYHTHCIGLEDVPDGAWFCMECNDLLESEVAAPAALAARPARRNGRRSNFFPRTLASMRRARQRARSDEWQGAWGQIAGRVWDALSIDLDNHEDEDDLEEYRRSQRQRDRELREYQRWQQRLNIASRLGARDVFESNIPGVFGERGTFLPPRPPTPPAQHQPPRETREEKKAWGDFERAIESETANSSSSSRKRKSRSITASPSEPRQEPERKLKRPRTRRLPVHTEPSSSGSPSLAPIRTERNGSASNARSPPPRPEGPSFLSSLLREVEMSTPSDDENVRSLFGQPAAANDPSSPAASPSASGYSSPRALSLTPPPPRSGRPSSPTLSLSSHIEPLYPPANYSPTRSAGETSDSESRPHHQTAASGSSELRQPRPQRSQAARLPRSQDVSPVRSPLPLTMKENISNIVRSALQPHWKSSQLTAAQYATINRDVSRRLYEEVADPASVDDQDARRTWEKLASREVARAMAELKA